MIKPLAIIAGTGIDQLEGLVVHHEHDLDTPFGPTSGPVQEGVWGPSTLFFLQRHGGQRAIAPHRINYRANIWALKALGVSDIVAFNAVGGISAAMQPGRLVIPDQLVDYTWGREHTFADGQGSWLMHVDFTDPYDRALRMQLLAAARAARIAHEAAGTYGVTQGPRLESAAEIRRLARDGCDVVGMTGMPEAVLSRELSLPYASICIVVNLAAGLGKEPLVAAQMTAILEGKAAVVATLLSELLRLRQEI